MFIIGANVKHSSSDLSDLLQPGIILQEESQVLVGDVHVTVASLLPVLLHWCSASREGVLVDLGRKKHRTSDQFSVEWDSLNETSYSKTGWNEKMTIYLANYTHILTQHIISCAQLHTKSTCIAWFTASLLGWMHVKQGTL